jgi:hypothetical protein
LLKLGLGRSLLQKRALLRTRPLRCISCTSWKLSGSRSIARQRLRMRANWKRRCRPTGSRVSTVSWLWSRLLGLLVITWAPSERLRTAHRGAQTALQHWAILTGWAEHWLIVDYRAYTINQTKSVGEERYVLPVCRAKLSSIILSKIVRARRNVSFIETKSAV